MAENKPLETVQDRKITWGLIAIVVVFVIVMSGIVLWITSSLIQNELGGSGRPLTTGTIRKGTPDGSRVPVLVDATWTPAPKSKGFIKFLYWYVKPQQITVGDCIQLTWETENADSLQLFRDGELILDDAPLNRTLQDCPKRVGFVVYRMVAKNNAGESNWIELQVRVQKAP
jgi:hypothetical protein